MNTSHYPSLELCLRLTEAGFRGNTMFTQQSSRFSENWYAVMNTKTRAELFDPRCFENWSTTADIKRVIVYPSVMELLDEMPRDIHVGPHQYTWSITPYGFTYSANQSHSTKTIPFFSTDINSNISIDPNALAEMWLWLNENGYLLIK